MRDQIVRVEQKSSRLARSRRRGALTKQVPESSITCMHALAVWGLVSSPGSSPGTSTFPDGHTRPDALVGGRPGRKHAQCVLRPGHDGEHRTNAGRTW